jgi:hypothetical protein
MIRWNEQLGRFDAFDAAGNVIPPEQLTPALRVALGRGGAPAPARPQGELVSGAITGAVELAQARPFPTRGTTTSTIVHRPVSSAPVALTADEQKVCRLMGISEADFLATRARQPHRWASEAFSHDPEPRK